MRLTRSAFVLLAIGVAVGLLIARFLLPSFGLATVNDSELTKPVAYT